MEAAIKTVVGVFLKSAKGKENLGAKEFQGLVKGQLKNILTGTEDNNALKDMRQQLDNNQDGKVSFQEYMTLVGYLAQAVSDQRSLEKESQGESSAQASATANTESPPAEPKPESKPEPKPEPKPESKPEPQAEPQAAKEEPVAKEAAATEEKKPEEEEVEREEVQPEEKKVEEQNKTEEAS